LLIINGLFSVTSNNVKDIYTAGDHPHQFGREVHFGDLLCSNYQRMIPVCNCGNREDTWNGGHLFWVVAGGHWVVTVAASHL